MIHYCRGGKHLWPPGARPVLGESIPTRGCKEHPRRALTEEEQRNRDYWSGVNEQELLSKERELDAKAKRKDPKHVTLEEGRQMWEDALIQRPRADLRPEDIRAVIDSREQTPLELLVPWERGTLAAGDYSIRGLESVVTVERKSLPDLVGCVGRDRDRFEACVQRMKSYEVRALVVEASWTDVHAGAWRSQMTPSQVKGALYSWMKHMSVILAGDRDTAAAIVSGILYSAARDRWKQLQGLKAGLKIAGGHDAAS